MPVPPGSWPRWRGLGVKLFLSYVAIIAVGIVTVLLAAQLVAPTFFAAHMADMLASDAMARMMGAAGGTQVEHASELDAALQGSFRAAVGQALLVAGAAALATAVGAALFVTGRVVSPIRRLALASQRLAAGHYAERVPVQSSDELGELADSFNALANALEATERRRLQLIGDVAHELRTPAATLHGYLEGLLDGVVEPNQRTWAKLDDEAARLARLIDDLQELWRAEARQVPLALQPVEPARIARAALDRMGPAFDESGLMLTTDMPGQLPSVIADEDRAVQVVTNLLTNALRYTPSPGSVRLALRPLAEAVEFAVADTGVGIAPEHLPHVFERFYRVDKSRSRALGGSGIGLTIARALVEAMGGRTWAESPGPGQGTTVTFTLPTVRETEPAARPA
jgi:two-component system sensor histidine kinase BaeS